MRQQISKMGMEARVPTKFEFRVPRHLFSGVADLSAVQPKIHVVGQTAELSRFGCFVQTSASVPVGTKVSLRITHCGTEFTAPGEVIYILGYRDNYHGCPVGKQGMGIKFAAPVPKDEAPLEAWLEETTV